jgi:hypothetical protein
MSYTLPINTLVANGDVLELYGYLISSNTVGGAAYGLVKIGGVEIKAAAGWYSTLGASTDSHNKFAAKLLITRKSATVIYVDFSLEVIPTGGDISSVFRGTPVEFTINNMTSSTNEILLQGSTTGGATVSANQLLIKLIKQ